jgi:small-conductance mechanosensitive channel
MRFQLSKWHLALMTALYAVVPPGIATAATGSQTAQADQAPATQTRQSTTTTTTEKQQYVQATQQHLNRLKRDVGRLQRDAGTAANRSLRVAAGNLAVGLEAAQRQFAALKQASGPVWRSLRAGLDKSLMALDQGVKNLDAKLRRTPRS